MYYYYMQKKKGSNISPVIVLHMLWCTWSDFC